MSTITINTLSATRKTSAPLLLLAITLLGAPGCAGALGAGETDEADNTGIGQLSAADTDHEASPDAALQVVILSPAAEDSCYKLGDFVQLAAHVTTTGPSELSWSFQSNDPACPPVNFASNAGDEHSVWEESSINWGTSCALDVPNHCSVGKGKFWAEVKDEQGHSVRASVPFCLNI